MQELFRTLDHDDSGGVEWNEFLPWWLAMKKAKQKARVDRSNHARNRRATAFNMQKSYLKMSSMSKGLESRFDAQLRSVLHRVAYKYDLDAETLTTEFVNMSKGEGVT